MVEDVHWADEATLDVLRYVGRRIAELPAVLLLTYRDDEIVRDHPLRRVLGALSGSEVLRIALTPLSRDAVASLAGGTAATADALYRLTDGNPFFVSEVLASPPGEVPTTVVDAVQARVRLLEPATQRALEQLAVVPSGTELALAPALLGELTVLREAELRGIVQVGDGAVGFRHELARQAVLQTCPASTRIWLNQQVLAALLALDEPDLARVVHHAIEAGDDAAVVTHAPEAALRAIAAGAQGQAATLYEQALRRRVLLSPDERAALAEAYAWALFHSDRRREALCAAEEAVALREDLGGDATLGQALACLSVQQWSCLRTGAALESSERRLGEPVETFPGCPEEYAAGLRGDWRAAAAAWQRIGDPYERALELVESGEVGPTLEALAEFDRLGARPAAGWARRRLRALGVAAVPRGRSRRPGTTRPG